MLEDYIKSFQKWPRSTSCKEMSFFLMCMGYYRSFITRYSALTSRMNAMNKDVEVQVIRGHEEGFQGLR